MSNNVFVTQPFLPPLEEFIPFLEKIWRNKILTNNGPFHQQLEKELAEYLGVRYISLFTNGTLALVTALQEMRITGEVITTPFSFVATSHSLLWNNIKPVFVDIEPIHFNIDVGKIESAITPQTTAILPVHVYGNPCDVFKIKEIADNYGLKVIYDAAHAFGVKFGEESLLNFGDMSILSFHATKVYNTFEGGAIICHDEKTKKRIDYLKNFGFAGETTVVAPGINSKMTEFQSALGILQLKYIGKNIEERGAIARIYRNELMAVEGISFLNDIENVFHNYSYFPILIDKIKYGKTRDDLYAKLKRNNIYARRYFYPLISNFSMYNSLKSSTKENLPYSNVIANNVLCLPIYPGLEKTKILDIISIINGR
jgi:dTDP-4-amino-4,6-dideoxygalactose transaminase